MATRRQIGCINKSDRSNPHTSIQNIGGIENGTRWKISEAQAIQNIESGLYSYFVNRGGEVNVIVATRNGKKYLKTVSDGETPDNLLSLPECP